MSKQPKFLDLIRDAEVTPAMMDELAIAVDDEMKSNPDNDDPERGMWVLFRVFGGKLSPHTITAIMFRMEALSALVVSGHTANWQLPGSEVAGPVSVNAAVLAAAAKATLILSARRGETPRFDVDEFQALVLAEAEAEGRG